MTQTSIPYLFIRGGSSRGPFFNRADLPEHEDTLSQVLIAAVGSGHPLNIDGIGGGNAVTTKVAMLSKSDDDWADIDYFFAQVSVEDCKVDYKPTCGNMMIGVGPASIEMGLINAKEHTTEVRIRAVNTGAKVCATIQTPDQKVNYAGSMTIDGVPGSAAPVALDFHEVAGSSTGSLLPTGNAQDIVNGVAVSCVDFAMPMVIARAEDFGLTGYETREELDANKDFFKNMERVRLTAGKLMGMGDCSESVTPKFGLVAKPQFSGGTLSTRYFMPWATHPTLAVTGSQCLSACALIAGSVAEPLLAADLKQSPATLQLEHPLGRMEVVMQHESFNGEITPVSAGVVRTARKLAEGKVFVPADIWS